MQLYKCFNPRSQVHHRTWAHMTLVNLFSVLPWTYRHLWFWGSLYAFLVPECHRATDLLRCMETFKMVRQMLPWHLGWLKESFGNAWVYRKSHVFWLGFLFLASRLILKKSQTCILQYTCRLQVSVLMILVVICLTSIVSVCVDESFG